MSTISIIPEPQSIEIGDGHFIISAATVIVATDEAKPVAEFLTDLLRPATGFDLHVAEKGENAITLTLLEGDESEGYTLAISETSIRIEATTPAGLFYGVQTLRQLLPITIESDDTISDVEWSVPIATITDAPRFAWRGLHLDVARHYFDVTFIKKFIDLMALYKLNVFHWHLTEDQGWRIEIKKYPKLTEIGSKRSESPLMENRHQGDGKPYDGGYYTHDEVREVVAYAAARSITVVPEIEMPGHAVAALTSYPELGCVGEGYVVRTTWGIAKDVFCAGKDSVFTFLENVLTEVLDLFPSEFIHIGGDECPKDRWQVCPDCQARIKAEGLADEHELQSYFIRRMERWLNERGRRLIGWDEILEGGLAPNATVMSWRGSQGGIDAANAGHDVVMSPTTNCYFDYYQAEDKDAEPPAIGRYLPLERVYQFQPIPEDIDPAKAHHVLGGQGNIWTEYIPTSDHLEYMTYPRAIALAEIVWSYPEKRDFSAFKSRLNQHNERLNLLEVNYRPMKDDD
ncbi:MAG: beta-N-acetylhexosaminidase [Anaerolineae bacterium]|nr:beta-N-acetylhexosaminidase [Anaerolineae bacterium]MDQ7037336.1 beta-N-acetylhexosaminidase [Anaerolineae bacterium]